MKIIKYLLVASIFFIASEADSSEIIRITKDNLNILPKGKEVDGRIGDWLIRNKKVIAIIGNAVSDREANQMVSSVQGAVLDFTTLTQNNDQLTVYYPQGARVDVTSADTIIILKASGALVQLKAVKYATKKEPFTAETTYSLGDNDAFLQVSTVYKNTSAKQIKLPVYDVIRCDNGLEDITPSQTGDLAFVYNKWYNSAYGVSATDRQLFTPLNLEKKGLVALGHKIYFDGLGSEEIALEPGKEITISRNLLTGANVADLQVQLEKVALGKLSQVNVAVQDKNGKRLQNVFTEARNAKKELVSSSLTDKDGNARLLLPSGEFKVQVSKLGHNTLSKDISLSSSTQALAFSLEAETKIVFHVTASDNDFIPVKVELKGINGTKNPFLGPGTRSNGIQNLYYSNDTDFSIPVPTGSYQVIISHGPEYNVVLKTVNAAEGSINKVSAKIERAFSSPGYIIADLHNHSTGSGDSNAGISDKVINMAASGIEFAPATEHNRISTYDDAIKDLGLQKYIASAAGIELSGRPGPGEINHQIGFPLAIQLEKRGNGAPKTDKDPYIQMKRLYDYDGGKFKLMQQNHPGISTLYFDKDKDGIRDKGYGTEEFTDVMEVRESMLDLPEALNGGNTNTRSFQWLQMLNLGYRIFGVANSDAHTIGNGSGSIFNYIYTKSDQPERIDAVEIAHQVKDGHVIMSNGPFMKVSVNNSIPGNEIKAIDGKINIAIEILTANWCKINTVQVLVNGKADSILLFTKNKNPQLFAGATNAFISNIPLTLKSDAHIIVLAYSENENIGLVTGGKKIMPMALSNPIYVDVDGNGFTPNKDLMGQPLPAKKSSKSSSSEEN